MPDAETDIGMRESSRASDWRISTAFVLPNNARLALASLATSAADQV